MSKNDPPPAECANCGAAIPRNARACPECGADERTGWREKSLYDNLDLPDTAWRDDDSDSQNESENSNRRINGVAWYWWCIGVLLLLLLGLGFVRLL